VARAVAVLDWMAKHPETPWSIRQVARDMDTSPTTVHRIFTVFEAQGLLDKDGLGGYLPSLGLYKLCRSIAGQDVTVVLARPYLEALAKDRDETVMLGAFDARRGEMMYVDVLQAHHAVQHMVTAHEWRPVYAGATGLAILAFLPDSERQAIYERGLKQLTDRTVVDADALEGVLADVRRAGFAFTKGHHRVGTVGFAAPVFDCSGVVFGDVCVTIPAQRFQDDLTESIGQAVITTAAAVSEQFRSVGYRRGFG
jgi:DNA-binding IclR family transcriptional regulator